MHTTTLASMMLLYGLAICNVIQVLLKPEQFYLGKGCSGRHCGARYRQMLAVNKTYRCWSREDPGLDGASAIYWLNLQLYNLSRLWFSLKAPVDSVYMLRFMNSVGHWVNRKAGTLPVYRATGQMYKNGVSSSRSSKNVT